MVTNKEFILKCVQKVCYIFILLLILQEEILQGGELGCRTELRWPANYHQYKYKEEGEGRNILERGGWSHTVGFLGW